MWTPRSVGNVEGQATRATPSLGHDNSRARRGSGKGAPFSNATVAPTRGACLLYPGVCPPPGALSGLVLGCLAVSLDRLLEQ
jgi:hypothetical protein